LTLFDALVPSFDGTTAAVAMFDRRDQVERFVAVA
jgi:hypothetical protein